MVYNKIYAQIGEERHITLDPINYQYDVKQILVLTGETVPDYYEADVCNVGDTATLTMVGTAADGVEIPDKFLLDGRNVLVYVVIPGSGGDVQTRYDITIPVDERAEREDIDPSEAEQQQIDSLINALNSGVARAEAAATAAAESATDAEGSAGESEDQAENAEAWAVGQRAGTDVETEDPTYHNNSKYYAGMAEAAAEEAGRHEASWESWVRRAESAADDAEGSARAAAGSKADAAAAAQTATKKAAAAGESAEDAAGSAAEARRTVDGGVGAINTARDGAITAIGRAGTTQTGAVNQAGADQVTAVNQAGATQVQAVENKGNEVLDSIPHDYSDLVDDVADLTRQLNDETTGLGTKAPVILETASGAIASFDDGADGMPIKKLVANIEPVQSGTGDPSPDNVRPISGWTGAILGNTVPAPESGITFPFKPKQAGSGDPSPTNIRPISGYDLTLEDGTHVTVYGGALTFNEDGSADVKVTKAITDLGTLSWTKDDNVFYSTLPMRPDGWGITMCDSYAFYGHAAYPTIKNNIVSGQYGFSNLSSYKYIIIRNDSCTTAAEIKAALNGVKVFYQILPQYYTSYHLPNVGQLKTFLGEIGYTAQLLPINWETEAGTIYGGTVTLNEDRSADLVSEWQYALLKNLPWNYYSASAYFRTDVLNNATPGMNNVNNNVVKSSAYKTLAANGWDGAGSINVSTGSRICIMDRDYTTVSDFISAMGETQIIYKLKTPQTYHLTPEQVGGFLSTYYGTNNVWIDTGSITGCDYQADTKLYVDGLTAPDEDMIANANIASGKYFVVNNQLYLSTAAIAAGASIVPGTNCTATNLAEALNALNT